MPKSNLRIITALVFSMVVHGLLIAMDFAPGRAPAIGLQKKVSVRLVARRAPVDKPQEREVDAREEKMDRRLPILPETVEVAVKEIPAFTPPKTPVVPDLTENIPDPEPEIVSKSTEESGGALSSAVVMARPLYLDNKPPEYPALARRRHWQGTVVLEVMVSSEGKVLRLRVNESSGREVLDEAALKAVSSWRFSPGKRGLLKVDMQVLVPVRFTLQ